MEQSVPKRRHIKFRRRRINPPLHKRKQHFRYCLGIWLKNNSLQPVSRQGFPEKEHQCYQLSIMTMKYPCQYKCYPVKNENRHQAFADSDAKPPAAEAVLPHGRYIDLTDRSHNRPESIVRTSPESHATLTPPNTSYIFVRHFAVQSDDCSHNNTSVSKFMSQNPQGLNTCTGCSKSRFIIIIIIGIQPLGRFGQIPELSQSTGIALVRCIMGKFLGVVCHCFPPVEVVMQ